MQSEEGVPIATKRQERSILYLRQMSTQLFQYSCAFLDFKERAPEHQASSLNGLMILWKACHTDFCCPTVARRIPGPAVYFHREAKRKFSIDMCDLSIAFVKSVASQDNCKNARAFITIIIIMKSMNLISLYSSK